jgi:CubicO group peptidase (beta-lactamase class C family)
MTSFGADGGIVSTAFELRRFTDAFFHGTLFPASMMEGLQQWNRIFFPMRSGIGIHQFRLPWIFNPFGTVPALIGHSGLSGTVAYYDPASDYSIAGTVNQIYRPSTSFRVMLRLLLAARKD